MTRTPRFIQQWSLDSEAVAADALAGLSEPAARISPKFFYDKLGSHLFEAITELDEYYPTRTERSILGARAREMAEVAGRGATLIDLGAGNCAKALQLMPELRPSRYVAVDISVDFLRDALRQVQRDEPSLDVVGLGTDFSSGLSIDRDLLGPRPVFFYPGSSIGNFTPEDAETFLAALHRQATGGGVLVGIDLVKPVDILQRAYDDAVGVTAAFNLNVLRCVNRLAGTDFEPRAWRHVAHFDAERSRIEMHLEARSPQTVSWRGGARRFESGERIHTENSCKYTQAGFASLLTRAGFVRPVCWTDDHGWFAVFWASAA